jgi:hypothetical protein
MEGNARDRAQCVFWWAYILHKLWILRMPGQWTWSCQFDWKNVLSEKELLSPFYAANCSGIPSLASFLPLNYIQNVFLPNFIPLSLLFLAICLCHNLFIGWSVDASIFIFLFLCLKFHSLFGYCIFFVFTRTKLLLKFTNGIFTTVIKTTSLFKILTSFSYLSLDVELVSSWKIVLLYSLYKYIVQILNVKHKELREA